MCCKRRNNTVRYQQRNILNSSLLSGVTPLIRRRDPSISALVGAVNILAIKPSSLQPQHANQVPTYPDDYKVDYQMDEPPDYERVSSETALEFATRKISYGTNTTFDHHKQAERQTGLQSHFEATNPQIQKLVEGVRAALGAYHAGVGHRKYVRKAQNALRDEMYDKEVARRQAMYGELRCGERSEIWREIKAIDFGR